MASSAGPEPAPTCSFDGCYRAHAARGLCQTHWAQKRRGKDLQPIKIRSKKTGKCSFPGCDRPDVALNLCSGHYVQQKSGKSLTPIRQIIPRQGICKFPDCPKSVHTSGLCRGHYGQWQRGEGLRAFRQPQLTCNIEGCADRHYALGWCKKHHGRFRKHGDPTKYLVKVEKKRNLEDGRRLCSACRRYLTVDQFTGTTERRNTYCIRCSVLRNYGMNHWDYIIMLISQGMGCAICGTRDPGYGKKSFAVDHDHACCSIERPVNSKRTCGKCVRGLLCDSCNTGIGRFNDNPDALRIAANYLEARSRPKRVTSVGARYDRRD
ncbi:endonuclease VII domain-containing protein [Streptomyces sp. CA-210063]|nr:endonuclease VII domain-containing protein [Streptomyces sp. CA-210063]